MYDVVRIQRALSEHAFVSSRPHARVVGWSFLPIPSRRERQVAGATFS